MLRKDRTRILCREPKVRPRSRAPHVLHGRGPDLFEPTAQRRRIRNRVPGASDERDLANPAARGNGTRSSNDHTGASDGHTDHHMDKRPLTCDDQHW